jgi:hypothetical protein
MIGIILILILLVMGFKPGFRNFMVKLAIICYPGPAGLIIYCTWRVFKFVVVLVVNALIFIIGAILGAFVPKPRRRRRR